MRPLRLALECADRSVSTAGTPPWGTIMGELRSAALVVLLAIAFPAARAGTFTVINTDDSGSGSLRQAILDANASPNGLTVDTIDFAIPGAGVHTITLLTSGEPITEAVTIDATTQPGTTTLPLIELTSTVAAAGFVVATSSLDAEVTIRGFVINGFDVGIQAESGAARVEGNFIGTDTTGTQTPNAATQLGDGVRAGLNASIYVGGATSAAANVIGGWANAGVYARDQVLSRPYVNNLFFAPVTVQGNFIGIDRAQAAALPNGEGVHIENRLPHVPVTANVIAHNGPGGAVVVSGGVGRSILDNSIYGNGSGIVLSPGANNDQPAPTLLTAVSDGLATRITGTQVIPPSEAIHVQLFTNPAAERQGRTLLGEISSLASSAFDVTFPVGSTPGHFTNGTATRITNDDTSESSNDLQIAAAPLLAKAFDPSTMVAGTVSTLRFTLTNLGATDLTDVSLSDTYPTGLANANPPNAATTCGGAPVFGASPGSGSFSASGLTVPAGSCEVTVAVTAAPGSYPNTVPAGGVVASSGPSLSPASATLQVVLLDAPGVTKSFTPASIAPGGASTLTITLANGNAFAMNGVALSDTYPAGMTNAAVPNPVTTCGPGVAAAPPGPAGASLSLSGGTIPPNGSCTVSVTVTASGEGPYLNDLPAGAVTSPNSAPSDGVGSAATLIVGAQSVVEVPALSPVWLLLLAAVLAGVALVALRQH